jgi:membrane protein implicated in regulation of membrane protease activity
MIFFYDYCEGVVMKPNVGGLDRIIRIVLGVVLLGLAATGTVGWWGWLGVVPLATGALGWCPPYAIFGFNTCAIKKK